MVLGLKIFYTSLFILEKYFFKKNFILENLFAVFPKHHVKISIQIIWIVFFSKI